MTTPHPFRFGVLCEQMPSVEAWISQARQAEEAGYTTLLIRDHFVPAPFGDQLAPLIALMAAADATRTLRVGSLVLDNDYRHPVLLAKEVATLDLLSGGRCELGIGAGWLRAEYEQAGLPFEAPSVRVSRLEEAIQVLKGLWSGQPLTFAGTHYRVQGLSGFPLLHQPKPPRAGSRRSWKEEGVCLRRDRRHPEAMQRWIMPMVSVRRRAQASVQARWRA